MNPAIARPELIGDAAISVSTWRSKISPVKEAGAGLMILTFGPGLCAHPLVPRAVNATMTNNRTRNGAIFTKALLPSIGVARSRTLMTNSPLHSAQRMGDAITLRPAAHNGSWFPLRIPNAYSSMNLLSLRLTHGKGKSLRQDFYKIITLIMRVCQILARTRTPQIRAGLRRNQDQAVDTRSAF
jgi:hypothetical protein